ncbi:hypothetical protein CRE_21470 [Caenorhabditis remanei]|uniref:Domain of unknown function DB domain-containing protein n=1 Tax=Caenorhabditis remanei TaxID=31234 RepID=E3N3Q5_CAERE|nr:hypothetical protein CRE_21470 [Caenorhabditis remanei]
MKQEETNGVRGMSTNTFGSSHEWKVAIIPRGQNNKATGVNSIPPFTIDGKADERFNKFYRTIDSVINKLDLTNSGDQNGREKEPQIRLEGNTKDLSVESSAVVIVPRTTVAPGVTNKVSVIPFRPLHFTAPPKNGPPGVSPPPAPGGQCGVSPDFTPCVSNEIASKSLLECCKRKNLPAGCQQLCRYDITQAEIRAAMDRGQCGIFNVAPFLECASQGKDNSECCRHRGIVQKTGPNVNNSVVPLKDYQLSEFNISYVEMQLVTCSIAIILVFAFIRWRVAKKREQIKKNVSEQKQEWAEKQAYIAAMYYHWAYQSGSSHEWKVAIIPRGQNNKATGVNSIPPFTIDGKADERFNKFYRIVIVPRTTVAPGVTNKVSVIPFRPLHFTAPPKNGPPGVSPPPASGGQCGVAPDFTPCVSNEIASKSLLECLAPNVNNSVAPPKDYQLSEFNISYVEMQLVICSIAIILVFAFKFP